MTRDRVLAFFRRTGRQAGRAGQAAKSQAYGVTQKAVHLKERSKEEPDDATLAHKVETELFRDPDVPKGDINVNAEKGVVYLRGQVADEGLAETLGKSARKIQGVREVENLLHTPGTPAPTKQR
jgi:osmotically-inducible protein OsmY